MFDFSHLFLFCCPFRSLFKKSTRTTTVALELLRHQQSIVSASTESTHFKTTGLAQRAFSSQSISSRSKFDRESSEFLLCCFVLVLLFSLFLLSLLV
jgi:hypothetical protein